MFVRVKRKIATKKHKKRKFIFWCLFLTNIFSIGRFMKENKERKTRH